MVAKPSSTGLHPQALVEGRVRFVLVEPQTAGNVGAVARALKNLGFSRLEVVRPQCDLGAKQARMMAVEATDLLDRAGVYDDLDAAIGAARTVVGTSRRKGKYRRPHYRLDLFSVEMARFAAAGELAVLFGREDSGLTDRELDRCTHLVYLPAADAYPSFNLAQSVLLVAYEVRRAWLESTALEEGEQDPPAGHAEREAMYRHLARALHAIGFLQDETVEPMMRRFRRLFGRAAMTPEEVQILRGVARQMLWAAGRQGTGGGSDEP
jgi:tRNA/rRNA methyltransferase